jgi:dTDP-glucose 4,6-dehydratase
MNACVLVTGAEGFIGSHLVEALLHEGRAVRAFVQYNFRNDWGWLEELPQAVWRDIDVRCGDLRDATFVTQAVKGCETVFHLGALIGIPYSYQAPREYVDTNVLGTLNVLQAALDCGVGRVVHTSTSEVYGTAQYVPIDEKHPLRAQSPYAATKIGADKLAESYFLSFGLPVVTVRPFNTYGPRQSARAVIPTIVTQALSGETIRLGALHPERDLTFVTDTARGFIAAAHADALGETINLGQGECVSIGMLAERILGLLGVRKPIVTDDKRLRPEGSEVLKLVCDRAKAERLLGWKPTVSLDDGLQRTIEWFRARLPLYKSGLFHV